MMYDTVLELPIFQGLSHDQLTNILEKVPFHFQKVQSGVAIVRPDEHFQQAIFILSGKVRMLTPIFSETMSVSQDFEAPYTIPFYHLFGKETMSRSIVYAIGSVGMMSIDKENFLRLLETNRLMLINVLNILSTHAQKQHVAMDCVGDPAPVLRIATWLLAYTHYSAKNIQVVATMKDWCSLFNLSTDRFTEAINVLIRTKCVEFDDGRLKLIDRYGLRTFVSRNRVQKE